MSNCYHGVEKGLWNAVHSILSKQREKSYFKWSSLMTQAIKDLSTIQEMQETWLPSLDWEDPLEEEMATHFSILAWRIPWTEEPGRL